ncbi:intein-containing kinesin family member 19a precursor [Anaeramoeba flamelloides]|uniref:Intein-containing kinesin family member 19a n=1 Tax=Anaeramoeba flamelloides TaxID=1746091 RepID=A0ABQ8XL22_9EUKA|nr:intein-containing kinesin family member 19a precursor [Anaeramoeba flamelloides]
MTTLKKNGNSIQVVIRIRPRLGEEKEKETIVQPLNENILLFDPGSGQEKQSRFSGPSNLSGSKRKSRDTKFMFDYIADVDKNQKEVYHQTAKDLVCGSRSILEGYNCTVFAYGSTGAGKSLRDNSIVYTPEGPKLNGDLKEGDLVCTPDGKTSKILKIFPQGELPIYRVEFDTKDFIDCSLDHLWVVYDQEKKQEVLCKTKDLYNYFSSTQTANKNAKKRFTIRTSQTTEFKTEFKEKNNNSKEIFELGLKIKDKIPKKYLFSDFKTRKELLKILMELKGKFNNKTQNFEFETQSKNLSKDFKHLIESLGGLCKIKKGNTTNKNNNPKLQKQKLYHCIIYYSEYEEFFERKIFGIENKNLKKLRKKITKKIFLGKTIKSVQKLNLKDHCTCIMIDHPDHLYLTNNFIKTHNTYTMMGCRENEKPGIMYLAMKDLFKSIRKESDEYKHTVSVSYLEIYNETIRDLMNPKMPSSKIDIREDKKSGIIISNLSSHIPKSVKEVFNIINTGNKNRTQSSTHRNSVSSRSHAVLQILVTKEPKTSGLQSTIQTGKLNLIDLAGSERCTENTGKRLTEGSNINKSLLALGTCINLLGENYKKGAHIPYRNSKLTRLLKDSLNGNCRTVMIANISPSILSYEDTISTLLYANRVSNIKTKPTKNKQNVTAHITEFTRIISELRQEVLNLKEKLDQEKSKNKKKNKKKHKNNSSNSSDESDSSDGSDSDSDSDETESETNTDGIDLMTFSPNIEGKKLKNGKLGNEKESKIFEQTNQKIQKQFEEQKELTEKILELKQKETMNQIKLKENLQKQVSFGKTPNKIHITREILKDIETKNKKLQSRINKIRSQKNQKKKKLNLKKPIKDDQSLFNKLHSETRKELLSQTLVNQELQLQNLKLQRKLDNKKQLLKSKEKQINQMESSTNKIIELLYAEMLAMDKVDQPEQAEMALESSKRALGEIILLAAKSHYDEKKTRKFWVNNKKNNNNNNKMKNSNQKFPIYQSNSPLSITSNLSSSSNLNITRRKKNPKNKVNDDLYSGNVDQYESDGSAQSDDYDNENMNHLENNNENQSYSDSGSDSDRDRDHERDSDNGDDLELDHNKNYYYQNSSEDEENLNPNEHYNKLKKSEKKNSKKKNRFLKKPNHVKNIDDILGNWERKQLKQLSNSTEKITPKTKINKTKLKNNSRNSNKSKKKNLIKLKKNSKYLNHNSSFSSSNSKKNSHFSNKTPQYKGDNYNNISPNPILVNNDKKTPNSNGNTNKFSKVTTSLRLQFSKSSRLRGKQPGRTLNGNSKVLKDGKNAFLQPNKIKSKSNQSSIRVKN